MTATVISVTATGFDYDSLEPAHAQIARSSATAIRDVYKRAIPTIGQHLLAAKEVLPHGAFTTWAETELDISERSARNYMMAATWLQGKPATVAGLPPAILYALASPRASEELIQEVLVEAGSGKPLNATLIRSKLASAKALQIEEKAARRKYPKLTATERGKLIAKSLRKEERRHDRIVEQQRQVESDRLERLGPIAEQIFEALSPDELWVLIKALDGFNDVPCLRNLLAGLSSDRNRREP